MNLEDTYQAFKLEGTFRPSFSGSHYLSFFSLGPSKVTIDNKIIFEVTKSSDDPMGFLLGAVAEEMTQYHFLAGQAYHLRMKSLAPEVNPVSPRHIFTLIEGMLAMHMGFIT